MKFSKKHSLCGGVILLAVGVSLAGSSAAAETETQSALATDWSTAPVTVTHSPATIPNFKTLRVAKQSGFDRSTFEFDGNAVPGYIVRYTTNPSQCASGDPVAVAGAAKLEVIIQPANAYDYETQQPTFSPASIVDVKPNLSSVKQLKMSCPGWEAETSYIVGVASKKNFRVLELTNPARIVVDVQQ
ncbi:hypothetical protein LZC95_23230 [Pendulispora brunnea]|uniref:AMIN-like domain-containing protein n=1 Tax=Pendulispora brunnea TaxID=2905690 RepID=A0ABZ2KQ50_9BACT